MIRAALVLVAAFAVCSCVTQTPTQAPVANQTIAEIEPTRGPATPTTIARIVPGPTPSTRPTQTPTARGEFRFSNRDLGISFTFPSGWEALPRAPDDLPGLTIHGPPLGAGPEPIIFAITIVVDPIDSSSVNDLVDQQLAQVPSDLRSGIKRDALTIGGEPAEQVIGLPSQAGALETFVIHNGRLYLIILQPYDEGNESLSPYLAQARTAYGNLLSSWEFVR